MMEDHKIVAIIDTQNATYIGIALESKLHNNCEDILLENVCTIERFATDDGYVVSKLIPQLYHYDAKIFKPYGIESFSIASKALQKNYFDSLSVAKGIVFTERDSKAHH